jgi:hypothetical protein
MWSATLTHWQASDERIAFVSRRACAYRAVINDFASRGYSACSGAWVPAFLIIARLVGRTLRAGNAFGSTHRWASYIAR